jgi:hypothetical protein
MIWQLTQHNRLEISAEFNVDNPPILIETENGDVIVVRVRKELHDHRVVFEMERKP